MKKCPTYYQIWFRKDTKELITWSTISNKEWWNLKKENQLVWIDKLQGNQKPYYLNEKRQICRYLYGKEIIFHIVKGEKL